MSLDISLYDTLPGPKGSGIFVRENGQTREISQEEWDAKFPGAEPVVVQDLIEKEPVYQGNITHNLNKMAEKAGLYEALWRPEEIGITKAGQLVEPLSKGLETLKADPDNFERFNPSNGWGNYSILVKFVTRYLAACVAYPDATIEVSR